MRALQDYVSRFAIISEHVAGALLPSEALRGVISLKAFTGIPYCNVFYST